MTDTKSTETNCYSTDEHKKAIFKAGLQNEGLENLYLYFEAIIEVINERKRGKDVI